MRRLGPVLLLLVLVGAAVAACAPNATTAAPPGRDAAVPAFESSVAAVDEARLGASWRPGCPVDPAALRLVSVSHWGYDGQATRGELVVHADSADAMVRVFRRLYDLRFPVERMVTVEAFGADDDASMAANNTSAFNCRRVAGSSSWSEHAYGRAVDVNPMQNPYLASSGAVAPEGARPWLDRRFPNPGMVRAGDEVVAAFAAVGWSWGGDWRGSKDYQHFSATGR
jgi:hypothetical protein